MNTSRPTLIQVCAFIKRHYKPARLWTREQLVPFVEWYWLDARAAVIRERGRIVALAMARCMNTLEEATEPFHHNEAGQIVWIDDIVSLHPNGIGALMTLASQRFGEREWFAGHVFNRNGELRKLPWKLVDRIFKI